MEGIETNSDDDEVVDSPTFVEDDPAMKSTLAEAARKSNSLTRGMKLRGQADTLSLSGAVKKGFRKHGLKSTDSLQNIPDPSSPRNSKKFSFRSPIKSKKNVNNDDTMSMTSMKQPREPRHYRGSLLKLDDVVIAPTPFDDTVSMVESLLIDTGSIKQEDGIRDSIGRLSTVTLKKMIKLERPQGDRTDAKVLVLTPYRCRFLGVKAPFKVEADFHFLDIKSMDSPSPERLNISTNNGKIYFLQMIGTDDADHIIGRVALSLRTIFSNVALSRILKASLEPLGRQKVIQNMLNQADQVEPGPCGNFAEMYRCICDYLGVPVREDVEWDVDTIYLSQNCREINLKDFDLPETRDLIPIISVMMYNQWFEGLVIKNTKLGSEVLEFVLKVTRNSHNLKHLTLDAVGLKGETVQRLANNLIENKEACLLSLDLSNNPLEDKGILHLSGSLPLIKRGNLESLELAKTGLTSKGINGLCQSLRSSPGIMTSLTRLNLSGNVIKSDEAEGLYNFLASENHLVDLDISATDCSVEVYVSALGKGCTKHLQRVRLGRNHFYGKRSKDTSLPSSFQAFFEQATCLQSIDFSCMKLPPEALKCIMDGLLSNKTPGLEISLNLTSCELKSAGCQIIQGCIASITNIVSLDLTDNSIDSDMATLLVWLQQNRSVRELMLGKNFSGVKSKHMRFLMESVVELVQQDESYLRSLSLADSKIREYIHIVLGCLGSNTSLTALDISGNFMGDGGSRVLSKSLQINSRLKIVKLDRNNLSAVGFHEIANALEKNYTLRYLPYPVNDAVAAMKHNPEKTQAALARIQDLLLRNANSNRSSNEQQFRLQKVVTNTAQMVLDKVAEKVDDAINALEILDADSSSNDAVVTAKNLVKDAKNSRQLLSDIYGLGMEKTAGENSQLQCKIEEMAQKVDHMVAEHLKGTVNVMKQNAEAQCPHVYESIKDELHSAVNERCHLPDKCVKDHVIRSSGNEIVNKVSELNLAMATLISDKVTDSLLAALSQSNVVLTEQLNAFKQQQQADAELTGSRASGSRQNEDTLADIKKEPGRPATIAAASDEKEGNLLPNMRRERAQSVAKRRQRPVTSSPIYETSHKSPRLGEVPSMSDETKITDFKTEEEREKKIEEKKEEENAEAEDKEIDADKNDGIVELPDAPVEAKLEHVTKSRPKGPTRRRRNMPARPSKKEPKQGVDDFFLNDVSKTNFSETPTLEEEEEIKRKERIEEKKSPKKMAGMPMVTPDMLRKRKPSEPTEEEGENTPDKNPPKTEESQEERPQPRRPKGAMVMPGMGFGGDLLAEMRLKKLAKKPGEGPKSPEPDTSPANKTSPLPLSKKKELRPNGANANNNNSTERKSSDHSLVKGKQSEEKPPTSNKSHSVKGKPPPLPTKPKPALRHETRPRPVSEFLDSTHSSSLVRTRAASCGKDEKKQKGGNTK